MTKESMTDGDLICNLSGDHPSECNCKVHSENGLEPAAFATFSDEWGVMDDLDAEKEYLIVEDGHSIQPLFSGRDIIQLIQKIRDEENNFGETEDRIEEAVEAGHACALDRLEEILKSSLEVEERC